MHPLSQHNIRFNLQPHYRKEKDSTKLDPSTGNCLSNKTQMNDKP